MTCKKIFIVVTGGAIVGMVLGGLFGFGAAKITPDFFRKVIPWNDIEPIGLATFCGATVGILLGRGLASFVNIVQLIAQHQKKDK